MLVKLWGTGMSSVVVDVGRDKLVADVTSGPIHWLAEGVW